MKLEEAVKHLNDPESFDVKIIDYGLSRDFSKEA